jgi:predicted Zn-dependent peptidase
MSDFTKATMSTGNYRTVAKIPGTIGGGIMSVFTYTLNRLLNASIRESRGWTYAINASSGRTPPFREITIESNNIALEALDHIDSAVADCIASIPSKEETVRVVRLGLMNSDVMISHSPMTICRDVVSDLSHHGRIKSLETYHREIEAVTAGDLARVAEHLEPEFRWVRIIRP